MSEKKKKEIRTTEDLSRVSSESIEIKKARVKSGAIQRGIRIQEARVRSSAVEQKKAQTKSAKDSK